MSRYRHQRRLAPEVAAVLLEAFAGGRVLAEGAGLAGDRLRVLPVLFQFMWQRRLAADLTVPLGMSGLRRRARHVRDRGQIPVTVMTGRL